VKSVSIAPAVVAVGLAAALALAVLDRDSGLLTWLELSEQRSGLRNQIEVQRGTNAETTRQIEALLNDPHETDRAIREALNLAMPGETIVRFKRGKSPSETRAAGAQTARP
jgi:cell division protein FtsB